MRARAFLLPLLLLSAAPGQAAIIELVPDSTQLLSIEWTVTETDGVVSRTDSGSLDGPFELLEDPEGSFFLTHFTGSDSYDLASMGFFIELAGDLGFDWSLPGRSGRVDVEWIGAVGRFQWPERLVAPHGSGELALEWVDGGGTTTAFLDWDFTGNWVVSIDAAWSSRRVLVPGNSTQVYADLRPVFSGALVYAQPEPRTWMLLALALVAFAARGRRRDHCVVRREGSLQHEAGINVGQRSSWPGR